MKDYRPTLSATTGYVPNVSKRKSEAAEVVALRISLGNEQPQSAKSRSGMEAHTDAAKSEAAEQRTLSSRARDEATNLQTSK